MSDNGNSKNLVGRLREHRLDAGLSQEKLARRADCSTSTIRLAERGWRPSEAMAGRIATALGASTDDLWPAVKDAVA